MSRKKIITDRDIRNAIYDRNGVKWFRMQIKNKRYNESLGTTNAEVAFQKIIENHFRNGSFVVSRKVRLSELYRIYESKYPDRAKRYLLDMRKAIDLLKDAIGDCLISEVTEGDVDRYRTFLLKRRKRDGNAISGTRINSLMRMCHSAFHAAQRDRIIPKGSNPFDDYPKTEVLIHRARSFDPDEYRLYRLKAIEVYSEEYAMMCDLYLLTGMRDAEWCNVLWEMIDWNKALLILPPKRNTKVKEERFVPLVSAALKMLKKLHDLGYERPVPLSASEMSHRWTHLRTGQRPNRKTFKGTNISGTFHSLRKTVQTQLQNQSIHPNLIDYLMGHVPHNVDDTYYSDPIRGIPVVRKALEKMAMDYGF